MKQTQDRNGQQSLREDTQAAATRGVETGISAGVSSSITAASTPTIQVSPANNQSENSDTPAREDTNDHAAAPPQSPGPAATAQPQAAIAVPPSDAAAPAPPKPESKPEADTNEKSKPKPRWVKPLAITLGLVALVFAAIWGYRFMQFSASHASTDDAQIVTDVIQVTPQIGGNITKLHVKENQKVQAGALIAELDDAAYQADLAAAQANLAVARASEQGAGSAVQLTNETSAAQITQAQSGVSQAQSGIGASQADVQRTIAGVASAQAAVSSANANVSTAQATQQSAIAARRRAVQNVNSAQAQVTTAQAGVKAAQANVTAAQANSDKAAKDETRYLSLLKQDAVSAQTVDVATAAASSARAQVDNAQQNVAQAQATVLQRRADVAAAQDAVSAADATIAQARAQIAAARDAVTAAQANVRQTQAQVDAAKQNVAVSEAKRSQAVGQLQQAQTAPRQVAVQQANQLTASAKIKQAEAAVLNAEIALKRTKIYAPASGTVSRNTAQIGQQVAVGQAIMAVLPNNDVWVVANFKETQLKDVRPGQPVEVEVDTFPGHKFRARVDSLAAATGATFALLPPDNATGNYTKVVQRVPVKIVFADKQSDLDRLRGGLSVVATIQTK